MTCQELEELLGDWYDGNLVDTVLVIVEKHVVDCAHCGNQVALYRTTVALCRRLPLAPVPMSDAFATKLRKLILVEVEDE